MATILAWLSVVLVPLYMASLLGGPMLLMDWLRKRREETTRWQVALTDAIDGHFGALVSPVVTVKRPFWGPWKILIAVPFTRPAAVGRILALAHEVLSVAGRMRSDRYEIVLTPKQETVRTESTLRLDQPAERWPRDTRVAA